MSRSAPPTVDLDFSGRCRAPSALGWLVLACGGLSTLGVIHEFDVTEMHMVSARHAYEQAHRKSTTFHSMQQLPPVTEPERRAALSVKNTLIREWNTLLASIERTADDPDLALLEVDQDGIKGQLKLSGEARNLPVLFAFAKRCSNIPQLRNVRLSSYAFRQSGPLQIISFELNAHWETAP